MKSGELRRIHDLHDRVLGRLSYSFFVHNGDLVLLESKREAGRRSDGAEYETAWWVTHVATDTLLGVAIEESHLAELSPLEQLAAAGDDHRDMRRARPAPGLGAFID